MINQLDNLNLPTSIPTAIVDFASAIQAIVDSQLDVRELVSKWADIVDDTNPKTVPVTLTSGESKEVKNLALVEQELREAVRETYPNINSQRSSFTGGSATNRISAIYGYSGAHGKGNIARSLYPLTGWTRSAVNDFVTYHPVNIKSSDITHTIAFSQLPRQVMLGYPDTFVGTSTVNNYTEISVLPIQSTDNDFDLMYNVDDGQNAQGSIGYHYSCITRFINHSQVNDHELKLSSGTRTEGSRRILVPKATNGVLNYADVLFFCGKGADVVNIDLLNGGGASYVNA